MFRIVFVGQSALVIASKAADGPLVLIILRTVGLCLYPKRLLPIYNMIHVFHASDHATSVTKNKLYFKLVSGYWSTLNCPVAVSLAAI